MKRVLLLTALALVVLVGSASAVPVLVNTNPAPHEWPAAWACYPTCVLPVDIVAGDFEAADGWIDMDDITPVVVDGKIYYVKMEGLEGTLSLYDTNGKELYRQQFERLLHTYMCVPAAFLFEGKILIYINGKFHFIEI